MTANRNRILKFATAILQGGFLPQKTTRRFQQSKFKLISDIFKDYKALKKFYPISRKHIKYQSRILRHAKMTGRINSPEDDSNSPPLLSRRQKLLGLAKATRDTYIPRFTGSVTLLASGVSSRAFGSGTNDVYDEDGNLIYPKDTSVILFPSYTRLENNKYHVDIKGWLSCPGLMTRKNRLILSLARQITRYNSNAVSSTQAINDLENERLDQDILSDSEVESIASDNVSIATENSQNSANSKNDVLIKERLACFIARSIPYADLSITIGSDTNRDALTLASDTVKTDINGHFETCIEVNYLPSVVEIHACTDHSIFAFQEIMVIPNGGIGLISDIDDTIKLTGVVGDKRELMTNLLLKDISLWMIKPVIDWYGELYKTQDISFHYVSNSPWQLYSTLDQYFKFTKLPLGSVHLKQYTGNIIASLMEPSSSRKKRVLYKILQDFPNKKFICVGDSGEHDIEAYVDLAKNYPSRIAAIYIRYVDDSLSDSDDHKILTEITRLLLMKRKPSTTSAQPSEDLIDLSDTAPLQEVRRQKLPPMIPNKPSTLKGTQLKRKPPTLPRDTETPQRIETPPPLPKRKTETPEPPKDTFAMDLHSIFDSPSFFELEEMDKKGAQWIRRIVTCIEDLEGTDTELKFFIDDDTTFFENSLKILKNHLKQDLEENDIL